MFWAKIRAKRKSESSRQRGGQHWSQQVALLSQQQQQGQKHNGNSNDQNSNPLSLASKQICCPGAQRAGKAKKCARLDFSSPVGLILATSIHQNRSFPSRRQKFNRSPLSSSSSSSSFPSAKQSSATKRVGASNTQADLFDRLTKHFGHCLDIHPNRLA